MAAPSGRLPVQLGVVIFITAGVGWTVGAAKLTQVLMTAEGGRFETHSEQRAESFLVTFGLSKAAGNLVAGACADMYGRRPVMLLGWVASALMAGLVLCARSWALVVFSDLLLGLNQALCFGTAIFVSVDLLGPHWRSAAIGLVETVGYAAIAISNPVLTSLRVGVEMNYACLLLLALVCSAITVWPLNETATLAAREEKEVATAATARLSQARGAPAGGVASIAAPLSGSLSSLLPCCSLHQRAQGGAPRSLAAADGFAADEAAQHGGLRQHASGGAVVSWPSGRQEAWPLHRMAFARASCLDTAMMVCCLAGLTLNFTTAFAWGALSRWLTRSGAGAANRRALGMVLFAYSLPKGVLQWPVGLAADSRACCGLERKGFVVLGLGLSSLTLCLFGLLAGLSPDHGALSDEAAALAGLLAALLGSSTALSYSTLLACASSLADPSWRSSSLGAVRFWRDLGYAIGGLVLGAAIDASGGQVWVAALIGAALTAVVAVAFSLLYSAGASGVVDLTEAQSTKELAPEIEVMAEVHVVAPETAGLGDAKQHDRQVAEKRTA